MDHEIVTLDYLKKFIEEDLFPIFHLINKYLQ